MFSMFINCKRISVTGTLVWLLLFSIGLITSEVTSSRQLTWKDIRELGELASNNKALAKERLLQIAAAKPKRESNYWLNAALDTSGFHSCSANMVSQAPPDAEVFIDGDISSGSYMASGMNSLHSAIGNGYIALTEILLELQVDIEAQDHGGLTPLSMAVFEGNIVGASLLLEHGACVNPWVPFGYTLHSIANGYNRLGTRNEEMIQLLNRYQTQISPDYHQNRLLRVIACLSLLLRYCCCIKSE